MQDEGELSVTNSPACLLLLTARWLPCRPLAERCAGALKPSEQGANPQKLHMSSWAEETTRGRVAALASI
jgi:hypothetical protein